MAAVQERKGRPKVFDDVKAITKVLLTHTPKANGKIYNGKNFPEYLSTWDEPTDVQSIQAFKDLLTAMACLQPDLRFSYPSLTVAIKNIYHADNYHSKTKGVHANDQAMCLATVARHWLRDVKKMAPWVYEFGVPLPDFKQDVNVDDKT